MKAVGYLVAGGLLLIMADFMPKTAVGLTSALLLGTILTSPGELQSVATYIKNSTGAKK
jgi:hypothetical protein